MTLENLSNSAAIFTLLTFINCNIVIYFCICRLASNASRHFKRIRLKFVIVLTGASVAGYQSIFFAKQSDIGLFAMSLALVIYMIINRSSRRG